MDQFIPQLVSAAVIGAVSPIPTMATIVVLSSRGALRNAIALLLGWSVVLLLSVALRNLVGARHPLERPVAGGEAHESVPAWMRKLDALRPVRAFGLGAVLLAISPANIGVYLSALQGLQDVDSGRLALLVALIVAIDLCILIPIAIYVCMPRRADRILDAGKAWLLGHQRALVSWLFAVFGLLLVLSGATHLA